MKIAIIGTGYVGLPAGACFADFGNEVVCVDKLSKKIESLNNGDIPLYEPGLLELVKRNREAGRLTFTTDLSSSIKPADIIILAVGTPTDQKSGHADLTYIKGAATEIAQTLTPEDGYKVIATKSTVPIGTNEMLSELIASKNPNIEFDTVSLPEFLREGKAVEDFLNPERIVIGVENDRAKKIMEDLYSPFESNNIPLLYCNRKSAEMIKYAANSFLGIKISYINEIADLCEKLDADVRDVAKGIGLDSRIGRKFLNPGPGFGGSCFPKDMLEILTTSKEINGELKVVKSAIDYNLSRGKIMADKISGVLGDNCAGKKVSILGLAFKAETDDIRMSPAIPVIEALLEKEIKIAAYDPKAMENMKKQFANIEYAENIYEAAKNSNAVVIMTEWNEFKELNFTKLSDIMNRKNIIDLRNILNSYEVKEAGFNYYPIGYNVKLK